jgi:DNA-binding GntR family transcriptional regulator
VPVPGCPCTVPGALRAGAQTSQDSLDRFLEFNFAFHLELARVCGNPVVAGLIAQLLGTGKHPLWLLMDGLVARDPATRAQEVVEHCTILAAIADGRGEEAEETMAAHLGAHSARIFGTPSSVTRSPRRRSA